MLTRLVSAESILACVYDRGQHSASTISNPFLVHNSLNIFRLPWRALLPGKCKLDDVIELRKQIAEAKPLEGRTEPFVLRGRNN